MTIPAARELPVTTLDPADVASAIAKQYAPGDAKFVRFYQEGLSLHKVYLSDRRYAWHDQRGNQIQVWSDNERFEDWLLDLHHRLLLGNNIGLQIVGFSGLLILPLMILGLVIWWPWRRSYRANLVPNSGRHGSLRKSHFDTGVTVFLPAALMMITGVILVYPTQARMLVRDGLGKEVLPITETVSIGPVAVNESLQEAMAFTRNRFPDSTVHWVSFPSDESGHFSIGLQESGSWNQMGATSLRFEEGQVVLKSQHKQRSRDVLLDYSYPVHAGKFPTWYRLLLSATGMLLAWLAFLGLMSYRKRARS